ncbi:UDP-N-acetylmuramate--L-alanine ligase [Salinimicrobium marinum]|uniref:UDP-N-acetylmuramate--L-alanine ligase n=1 Tax=Salinimicrobium marinum TaxID=680283 RepID=A0A918VUJ5_9FLAO|nr:UDP-N-acetylmuramate--L-alanine ligase [Salinimicrobium marinum]GHA27021.1 UDP-N-acetylmuramate--L-alanine ligase [Salinimicrobium marinum]
MSNFDHIKNMFFLGIGGIGMSALARYFNAQGINVAGYDKTRSSLTGKLESEGISVIYKDDVEDLPLEFTEDKNALIVYTPAIPKNHQQFNFFKAEGFTLEKRAVVLGKITKNIYTLAVAGTHGKTTTTAMLAHLLKETGEEVTAFLGGVAENYGSNLVMSGNKVTVVEADEFDRSFLQLSPNIAAITSMDADHLDIYGANEQLQQSFLDFVALVPQDGTLFYKKGLPLQGTSVGVEDGADVTAENVRVENGSYYFDLNFRGKIYKNFSLSLPGKHNLFNAVTALAMAIEFGCLPSGLARALTVFKGVHRRFSYRIKSDDLVLIDDYAHHPAEIAAVHQAVREMHPGKEVLVVFQPHLFSRTRDFADDFAASLSLFDQVLLLDIYPAREEPMEGITSEWLLNKIDNINKQLVQKEELSEVIKKLNPEVVMLLGAGDIGEEVETVKNNLLS